MIGGNTTLQLQVSSTTKNEIGEQVEAWNTVQSIKGFIDMMSGDSDSSKYNTKLVDATDVFVADYVPIDASINPENPDNVRAVVDGRVYDVKYIDDPMKLHKHLEIFLKYTGGVLNG